MQNLVVVSHARMQEVPNIWGRRDAAHGAVGGPKHATSAHYVNTPKPVALGKTVRRR